MDTFTHVHFEITKTRSTHLQKTRDVRQNQIKNQKKNKNKNKSKNKNKNKNKNMNQNKNIRGPFYSMCPGLT